MRLSDFILENIEPILADWVSFARTITPEKDITILRDHAAEILRATARDMNEPETKRERSEKSRGEGEHGKQGRILDLASKDHAIQRVETGFDVEQLLSEYRALRASVIQLWRESVPDPVWQDLDDITRFNEAIDQSMAEGLDSYTARVEETREMFLAILGHDLRNPLAALKLFGHVLKQNENLDPESLKIVRSMANTTDQMDRMICDLLDFAVTRMGESIPITTKEMDLETLCCDGVAEMQSAHPSLTIRCTPHGDLNGKWDERRLWQVVSNLLGNAVEYGANDRPIDLFVTGEPSEVVIRVHNEGKPIPSDKLPLLFDPMSRQSTEGAGRRPGSVGLGLYIVCEIVTAHGGSVQVKSSAEAGTDFIVRLPRHFASVSGD